MELVPAKSACRTEQSSGTPKVLSMYFSGGDWITETAKLLGQILLLHPLLLIQDTWTQIKHYHRRKNSITFMFLLYLACKCLHYSDKI